MTDFLIYFLFIICIFSLLSEDKPEDKRMKCIKNGITHSMSVDDIERLCGKAPPSEEKK